MFNVHVSSNIYTTLLQLTHVHWHKWCLSALFFLLGHLMTISTFIWLSPQKHTIATDEHHRSVCTKSYSNTALMLFLTERTFFLQFIVTQVFMYYLCNFVQMCIASRRLSTELIPLNDRIAFFSISLGVMHLR